MLQIVFHPTAEKEFLKIPRKIRLRILKAVEKLEKLAHPLQHQGVIKLSSRRTEDFRLRVGDYRIKFTLRNSQTILVTHVQHRQVGY